MKDATEEFFEQLGQRRYEPALAKATGTLRFDIQRRGRTVHWFVSINKGEIKVSRENRDADAAIRSDASTCDAIVSGRANAMAALIRGAMEYEGDPQLLVLFQRLFPGPADARERGRAAGSVKRQS